MEETKRGPGRPKVNSAAEKELDKVQSQFDAFDQSVKDLTLDRMNAAPKAEQETQTKLSSKEIDKAKEVWLKPKRSTSCKEPFNEKYRSDYEFAREYVQFIAENKEIIGETIDIWTKPFAGIPAEEWDVPVNKPVWGPRYLAEQVKRCSYHRLTMVDKTTGSDGMGAYYGTMVADNVIQRLDAIPVNTKRSVFMGSGSF